MRIWLKNENGKVFRRSMSLIIVEFPVQTVFCLDGSVTRQIEIGVAEANLRRTRRLERCVQDLCKYMTMSRVAHHLLYEPFLFHDPK